MLLQRAIQFKLPEVVGFLLDHGADVEAIYDGYTPLDASVKAIQPSIPVLQTLLDHGADLNRGRVLYLCCCDLKEDAFKLLLGRGADPNKVYQNGHNTILHIAASQGEKRIVKLLLSVGAKPEVTDFHGKTPLTMAAEYGWREIVQMLVDHGAKLDITDNMNKSALIYAMEARDDLFDELS